MQQKEHNSTKQYCNIQNNIVTLQDNITRQHYKTQNNIVTYKYYCYSTK